jgi:DNA-directed RNA polymerase subunit M/transcription elongation factor TFIIS
MLNKSSVYVIIIDRVGLVFIRPLHQLHWRESAMKCSVCGYRYKEPDLSSEENKLISDGDEPFIKLINTFHRKDSEGNLDEAYLFGCPRCKTVRMELW